MKIKSYIVIGISVIIVIISLVIHKETGMAMETDGSANQYISYSNYPLPENVASVDKTVLMWIDLDSIPASNKGLFQIQNYELDPTTSVRMNAHINSSGQIWVWHRFITTPGVWYTTNPISTGINHIAISYDGSSASNDPIIYVNGTSVAITEFMAPTGSAYTPNGNSAVPIGFSGYSGSHYGIDGKYMAFNIYDRVMPASEISDAFNSRKAIPTYRGLVFCIDFRGTAGGIHDGNTLAESNKIRDIVSGAEGTPKNLPLFIADTYLIWK